MVNPFTNPSYLMPPLAAFGASLILITVVLRGTRRSFSSWIFCGLLLSLGLWGLLLFGMRSSPDLRHALLWDRALPVAFYLALLLYYHFTLAYTNTSGQRRILLISYLFLAVFVALAPTDLIVERMRLEHYGYAPIIGPVAIPVFIIGLLLMGGAGYNLVKRYNTSPSYEERNRLLYLVIASLFPLTGALLDAFTNLPPAAIWTNLIFCILCSIAILKYHLLDIRLVVRKSLVYLLVSSGIAIPYVSLLYFWYYIFEPAMGPWWIHTLIILLLAIILRPLYSSAQQFVDRLFYRDRYDALRALEQFSREAQSIVNLKELSATMTQLVSGALRTSSACLLLPSEGKDGFVVVSSTGLESPPSEVVLRGNSPVIKWLELHKDILSSEQFDFVPQLQTFLLKEKNILERMGAKLYVPIKTRQGQLSGILLLGQKLSQQSYSSEDKQLLTAVSNQMAIALENARLYEETRESERVLMESEAKYRSLVNDVKLGIFRSTPEPTGRFLEVNPAMEEITGYSREELLQMDVSDLYVHPEEREAILGQIASTIEKTTRELRFRKKDETEIMVSDTKVAVRDDTDNILYFDGIIEDITERKQAEEALRESEEKLLRIFESANDGITVTDLNGIITDVNERALQLSGFGSKSDLVGKSSLESIAPRDQERALRDMQELSLNMTVGSSEYTLLRADGSEYPAEISAGVLKDTAGNLTGFVSVIRDITERKRAEEELVRLSNAVRMSTDSIVISNLEAKIIDVNEATLKMYGTDNKAELIGKSSFELIAPEEREKAVAGIKDVMEKGYIKDREYHVVTRNGSKLPVEMSVSIMKGVDDEPIGFVVVTRDITERKRATEQLEESNRFIERITSASPAVIYVFDLIKQQNIYASKSLAGVLGLTPEEFKAMGDKVLGLIIHPDDLGPFMKYLDMLSKDRDDKVYKYEYRMKHKNGDWVWILNNDMIFTRDTEQRPLQTIGVALDITERKEAEEKEKKLQQELYLSSRLAAIGELAAGVAHEINNPLTGILGFSQRLLRKSTDQEVSQGLEIIHSEALRAAKVVQNLLTFARRRKPTKEYSDINDILGRTLELRAYELETSNIEVVTDLAPSLPKTIANFQQIEEVFLNIIMNAEQAMSETNGGGKLTIKTQVITGNITVSFTDNGPGIPAEHLDKVFDPFFTTKEEGGGTGLGLSICHGIVVEHGGRIYARSKPGKGATFIVELPIVTEEVDRSKIVEG